MQIRKYFGKLFTDDLVEREPGIDMNRCDCRKAVKTLLRSNVKRIDTLRAYM